jgi:1-acyl-sn-glycerol-3-phosphate acyltransferase
MIAPDPAAASPAADGPPIGATKKARRVTPPRGWQFSTPAVVLREVTALLFGPIVGWFLCGPRVIGREHLAALVGPSLITPTHASHFDFSAIRLAMGSRHRRRMTAAAAADYFATKKTRWFMAAWLGAFAFNRTGRGADSIAAAEGLLAAGWHVVMFPEGTRTLTGDINPFQPGIGLLARHTGRQVLPVRIVGIRQVLPKGGRRPHRHPVEVRIGAPIRALPGEDARAFTARLEAIVRAL